MTYKSLVIGALYFSLNVIALASHCAIMLDRGLQKFCYCHNGSISTGAIFRSNCGEGYYCSCPIK